MRTEFFETCENVCRESYIFGNQWEMWNNPFGNVTSTHKWRKVDINKFQIGSGYYIFEDPTGPSFMYDSKWIYDVEPHNKYMEYINATYSKMYALTKGKLKPKSSKFIPKKSPERNI